MPWCTRTFYGAPYSTAKSNEKIDHAYANIIKALTDESLGINVNAHCGTKQYILFAALGNAVSRYRAFREFVKCKNINLLETVTESSDKGRGRFNYPVGSTVLMQLAKLSFEKHQIEKNTMPIIDDIAQEAWKEFLAALDERYSKQEVLDYLNKKDELGNSAFLYAAAFGRRDLCEELIRRKVDPKQKNNDGQNAFMLFASLKGLTVDDMDIVFNRDDDKPLESDIYKNSQERDVAQKMFDFLLEHDSECYKVVDNKNRNALMACNQVMIADLLWTHETFGSYFLGQVNAQDDEGKTALMALSNPFNDRTPVAVIARCAMIYKLLRGKADINIADNVGKTILDYLPDHVSSFRTEDKHAIVMLKQALDRKSKKTKQ